MAQPGPVARLASHIARWKADQAKGSASFPQHSSLALPNSLHLELEEKIKAARHQYEKDRTPLFRRVEVEDVVDTLGFKSHWWRYMDPATYCVILAMLLHSQNSMPKNQGFFMLLATLECMRDPSRQPRVESIRRNAFKKAVGANYLAPLMDYFLSSRENSVFRRWVGMIAVELLETPENVKQFVELDSFVDVGRIIVEGRDRMLKIVAGKLVQQIVAQIDDVEACLQRFLPSDAFDLSPFEDAQVFPIMKGSQWEVDFSNYLTELEAVREEKQLRAPLSFNAVHVQIGDNILGRGGISCDVVAYSSRFSIYIPISLTCTEWIDIDIANLESVELSVKEGPVVRQDRSGKYLCINMILRLCDYTDSGYYYLFSMDPCEEHKVIYLQVRPEDAEFIKDDILRARNAVMKKWYQVNEGATAVSMPMNDIRLWTSPMKSSAEQSMNSQKSHHEGADFSLLRASQQIDARRDELEIEASQASPSPTFTSREISPDVQVKGTPQQLQPFQSMMNFVNADSDEIVKESIENPIPTTPAQVSANLMNMSRKSPARDKERVPANPSFLRRSPRFSSPNSARSPSSSPVPLASTRSGEAAPFLARGQTQSTASMKPSAARKESPKIAQAVTADLSLLDDMLESPTSSMHQSKGKVKEGMLQGKEPSKPNTNAKKKKRALPARSSPAKKRKIDTEAPKTPATQDFEEDEAVFDLPEEEDEEMSVARPAVKPASKGKGRKSAAPRIKAPVKRAPAKKAAAARKSAVTIDSSDDEDSGSDSALENKRKAVPKSAPANSIPTKRPKRNDEQTSSFAPPVSKKAKKIRTPKTTGPTTMRRSARLKANQAPIETKDSSTESESEDVEPQAKKAKPSNPSKSAISNSVRRSPRLQTPVPVSRSVSETASEEEAPRKPRKSFTTPPSRTASILRRSPRLNTPVPTFRANNNSDPDREQSQRKRSRPPKSAPPKLSIAGPAPKKGKRKGKAVALVVEDDSSELSESQEVIDPPVILRSSPQRRKRSLPPPTEINEDVEMADAVLSEQQQTIIERSSPPRFPTQPPETPKASNTGLLAKTPVGMTAISPTKDPYKPVDDTRFRKAQVIDWSADGPTNQGLLFVPKPADTMPREPQKQQHSGSSPKKVQQLQQVSKKHDTFSRALSKPFKVPSPKRLGVPEEDDIAAPGIGEQEEEEDRFAEEQAEQKRNENLRLEEERRRLEKETREIEHLREERIKWERFVKERLERERLDEVKRLENERLKNERLEAQRIENERLGKELLRKERIEKKRLDEEKQLENEHRERNRQEEERVRKERLENERVERERLHAERIDRERERLEKEYTERLDKERLEKERSLRDKTEAIIRDEIRRNQVEEEQRLKQHRLEGERLQKIKLEQEAERRQLEQEKRDMEALRKRMEEEQLAQEAERKRAILERLELERIVKDADRKAEAERTRILEERLAKMEKELLDKKRLDDERHEREQIRFENNKQKLVVEPASDAVDLLPQYDAPGLTAHGGLKVTQGRTEAVFRVENQAEVAPVRQRQRLARRPTVENSGSPIRNPRLGKTPEEKMLASTGDPTSHTSRISFGMADVPLDSPPAKVSGSPAGHQVDNTSTAVSPVRQIDHGSPETPDRQIIPRSPGKASIALATLFSSDFPEHESEGDVFEGPPNQPSHNSGFVKRLEEAKLRRPQKEVEILPARTPKCKKKIKSPEQQRAEQLAFLKIAAALGSDAEEEEMDNENKMLEKLVLAYNKKPKTKRVGGASPTADEPSGHRMQTVRFSSPLVPEREDYGEFQSRKISAKSYLKVDANPQRRLPRPAISEALFNSIFRPPTHETLKTTLPPSKRKSHGSPHPVKKTQSSLFLQSLRSQGLLKSGTNGTADDENGDTQQDPPPEEDPDKTLVNDDEENSNDEDSSDGCSESGESTMVAESYEDQQDPVAAWRHSLPDYHHETLNILDRISRGLIRYLMSGEERAREMITDFEKLGRSVAENLKTAHQREFDEYMGRLAKGNEKILAVRRRQAPKMEEAKKGYDEAMEKADAMSRKAKEGTKDVLDKFDKMLKDLQRKNQWNA